MANNKGSEKLKRIFRLPLLGLVSHEENCAQCGDNTFATCVTARGDGTVPGSAECTKKRNQAQVNTEPRLN
jgi:hypothetical protein